MVDRLQKLNWVEDMLEEILTIRAFTPEDWECLGEVYERAARCEMAFSGIDPRAFRPLPEEENLERFQQLNTTKVVCIEGRIVGFVAWRDQGEWQNSGYLSWLYIAPAYHRRGIGNRLMLEALEALGKQAWTLASSGNEPAINLYQKHGMQIVRSRQVDYGGYPKTELRLALPTSRRFDPETPNFGVYIHTDTE